MRIVSGSLHMLCNEFIVFPFSWLELKFIIQSYYWIFSLVLKLFVGSVNVRPEILTKNLLIVKCIRNQTLDLFLYRSVKIFQRINNNPLLLTFVGLIQNFLEIIDFFNSPIHLKTDFFNQSVKFAQSLRHQSFNALNILLFQE